MFSMDLIAFDKLIMPLFVIFIHLHKLTFNSSSLNLFERAFLKFFIPTSDISSHSDKFIDNILISYRASILHKKLNKTLLVIKELPKFNNKN